MGIGYGAAMTVTVEQQDAIAIITMDDGKANALSFDMIDAISGALDDAAASETTRAVVLTGRPGKFSAGFDLGVMQSGDWAELTRLVANGGDLVRKIYGGDVPVVAASTGHALAAGALMLLGCDVRVSVDVPTAKVGLNEVAIGMTLPDWAHTIAEQRLSKRHIQRSIANARITDPAGAVDVGFLDRVVSEDELMTAAMEEAMALTPLDPSAYARTMRGFRAPTLELMDQQIAADRSAG